MIDYLTLGFLALMGFLFFLPGFLTLSYKLLRRLGRRKAEGKCLRIERNSDPDLGGILIQPVLEFWDRDGMRHEVRTGTTYGLRYMPRPGDTVKIYYAPHSQPMKFEVASRGLWQVAGIFMAFGLVLMLPLIVRIWLN